MLRHPSEFTQIPFRLLTVGRTLPVNVYVYLVKNRDIIHYRRTGDVISEKDSEAFVRIGERYLLVHRSESQALQNMSVAQLGSDIATLGVKAPAVKQGAADVLKGIEPSAPGSLEAGSEIMLKQATDLVHDLMSQFKRTPALSCYEQVLKAAKKGASDPLAEHQHQVSALAVLMLLTAGIPEETELVEIGTAGLLHDLGLAELPKAIVQRHLDGNDDFTSSEKLIFMRHNDLTLQALAKTGFKVSAKVKELIELHHENFDGSGFRGVPGNCQSLALRVLRVADDIVGIIKSPAHSYSFRQGLAFLTMRKTKSGVSFYDDEVLSKIADATDKKELEAAAPA